METSALDALDRRILEELKNHARLTWRELSERVHLAPSSVAERVRSMERCRVIRGYRLDVDPATYGRGLKAVIDVGLPPAMSPDEFEARLTEREEVTFAAYVTGKFDYTVIVDCNGSEGLDAFIRWLKADAGVAATESKLVLRAVSG